MLQPTVRDIFEIVTLFLNDKISREEMFEWSYEKNIPKNLERPYGVVFNDHVTQMAFNAICSATVNKENLILKGPPYFIRKKDYQELLASIEGKDRLDKIENNNLYLIRPHQLKKFDPQPYFSVNITPNEIEKNIDIFFIRGLDDLDYLEEAFLETKDGIQFILLYYMRSPETGVIIYGEPNLSKFKLDIIVSLFNIFNNIDFCWYKSL